MGKDQKKASKVDVEWERRVLCGDESCIGIIGPDGRCKECGLPYEGDLPAAFHHSSSAEQSAAPVEDDLSVDDTDDLLEPDEVDVIVPGRRRERLEVTVCLIHVAFQNQSPV